MQSPELTSPVFPVVAVRRPTLAAHVRIARPDHWFKNAFILPGVVVSLSVAPQFFSVALLGRLVLGVIAACAVASSNYVINELLDAASDRAHPSKRGRPAASGEVNVPLAYAQWIALMVLGVAVASLVSLPLAATMGAFWLMGCIYNIPPVRSKDLPYLDVLSEAVNNPLRMLMGWFIVAPPHFAPASLWLSYWMIGCYFMAMKRYAEYRSLADPARAATYRKSFAHYTDSRLLVSIMFYASAAMLFFGAFIVRYRLELVLAFPLVAVFMAVYLLTGLKNDSAAQAPEKLYREKPIMVVLAACLLLMGVLLFVDIPFLHKVLEASMPMGR